MANTNLIINPSFETNTTSWTFTNATATRDSSIVTPGVGAYACKMVASAAAKMNAAITVTGLTVGANYTLSFYVKTQPVGGNFSVIAQAGTVAYTSMPVIIPLDSFRRRYSGFQATATSMTINIFSEQVNSVGDIMWIDCVMLTADTLTPYFDGSFPSCSWTGTAHASTSTASFLANTVAGSVTTDEIVLVNNYCLNTLAWNITSKTGRYTIANVRGDDITAPGVSGRTFVANKPIDTGLWSLSMFVLGQHPDGSVPMSQDQRDVLADNLNRIIRQCVSNSAPVTIIAWQPSGTLLTTQATLVGSSSPLDATITMGGRRAEFTLAFTILPGVWKDYAPVTVTGTASSAWSNQSLVLTALAGGTAPIDDAVITVTGPIVNPTISNPATGTSVSYTGTVPAGQTWVVDSGAWTSKVNGVSALTNTTHLGHPRFLLIDPGNISTTPSVLLQGASTTSATNLSVTATRKHYLG